MIGDALEKLKEIPDKSVDLIFADPPFFKDDIHQVVENLNEREYLNNDGILLIERSVQTEKNDIESFKTEPFKRIGDSLLYKIEK